LGLVAWIGFGWAGVRAFRRQVNAPEWVMLAWAIPYLLVTGIFYAKFLRYMAPLLPFILVMGAGMLVALARWLSARWTKRGRLAWAALVAAILAATALWQIAFLNVYRQEHPWLQASRWIYANVPAGVTLLTEHWDDALPLRMDEIAGRPPLREYRQVELPLWDDDTPEKLDKLASELSDADYLVIATNRLYKPIQRLPQRYPMASKYYDLLFNGDLGYRKVAEFAAYPGLGAPRLGALTIRDDNADESFTVYDHPREMIFANEGWLSESLLRARLGRYLPLSQTLDGRRSPLGGGSSGRPSGHARYVPPTQVAASRQRDEDPGEKLLLSQPVDALPVVADFRWNRAASASPWLAAPLWWLAIALFGLLAWPLIFPVLPGLRDRGYGLARAIGWLLAGWLHWMGVNLGLWENRTPAIALIVGALLALAGLAAWQQRATLAAFWAVRRRLLLGEEALFAGSFLVFVVFRLFNPDLWQPWNGGEKFMEVAFLNAILRSASFPPYDPYFAGGVMNYYYYGLYLVSLPIKLTGIAPEVAFNLAVPSLFALTALGVFSVGATLAEGWISTGATSDRRVRLATVAIPLLAILLAMWMGNLASANQWLDNLTGSGWRAGFDYWSPSRVIPYTINEFPFWTFLFADLHPHLISMPFGMAAVGLSLHLFLALDGAHPSVTRPVEAPRRGKVLFNLLLLALVVGALGAINTWDLPTYLALAVGGLLLAGWRTRSLRALGGAAFAAGLIVALSILAYLPFYRSYEVQVGRGDGWALGRYLGRAPDASPIGDWLLVWGILLFTAAVFVVLGARRARPPAEPPQPPAARPNSAVLFWLLLIAVIALLIALGRPTAALAAAPMLLALRIALRRDTAPQRAFAAWLLALGLAVIAGTELIYLRDFLDGGDWRRMNTVFKFALPAWLFLSLAGGAALWMLWGGANEDHDGRPSLWRWLARSASLALVGAGLLFVVLGTPARLDDRFPGAPENSPLSGSFVGTGRPPVGTMDGTAYMTVGQYSWPDGATRIELRPEWEAIRWLLDNVRGTPVIAEAPAGSYFVNGESVGYDYYRAGGQRVASFTGFPTFVGHHQYEQRSGGQVGVRTEQGREFFAATDIARTRRLMRELGVGYIYVGRLERILFSPESLRKFDVMAENGELEVVYDNDGVRIYHVLASGS
jgi:YYY domain-containing protein